MDLLNTALALTDAGISVIPVRADGTKAPAVQWRPYITTPADEQTIRGWFTGTEVGLGIATGNVSGRLELTEIEGRAVDRVPELAQLADDNGMGELWRTVTGGWVQQSPSGGLHFLYRLDHDVPGNTKLARRPSSDDELADWVKLELDKAQALEQPMREQRLAKIAAVTHADVPQTLAETRGTGGYVVAAPSAGRVHETGRAWTTLIGGPATAPLLDADDRTALHMLIGMLDQMPAAPEPAPAAPRPPRAPSDGITPGDDYENRTDWAEILTPHGWTHVMTRGRTRYWCRPGKRGGISATTGHADDRDRLYVFTSSTEFAVETPYTKFGALALLEHAGDHSKAATALAKAGYGQRAEQPRTTADDLAGLIAPPSEQAPIDTAPAAEPATSPAGAVTPSPVTYTETDDGNALRLVDEHGPDIRYCADRGQWLAWDGHRWRWDTAETVRERARAVARDLPTHDKEATRHRRYSLSARGVEAMVRLARTDPRTTVALDALDSAAYQLNTPAGIVDLRTGLLAPCDPAALHTRSTTVAPDFEATPQRWLRFLADTFAGDPAITTYVQRLIGVSLVGTVLEQVLPFGYGSGANGKTTLLSTVQRVVGIGEHGYSISVPAEMLTVRHNDEHPAQIAQLAGARLVVTGELEDGARFAEAKVKMLTGGDTINARFMGRNPFNFTPTHTLWLHANHQPAVRAGGPAFWRRLRLLPFLHTVPVEDRVADLEDRLVDDEGPAILAWLIAGARDYFTHGLAEPGTVRAATAAYETEQDTVGRFVAEECVVGEPNNPAFRCRVSELRSKYETWCRTEGEEPVSAKALTTALKARFNVASERSNSSRFYAGIRLDEVTSDDEQTRHPNPSPVAEPTHEQQRWDQW